MLDPLSHHPSPLWAWAYVLYAICDPRQIQFSYCFVFLIKGFNGSWSLQFHVWCLFSQHQTMTLSCTLHAVLDEFCFYLKFLTVDTLFAEYKSGEFGHADSYWKTEQSWGVDGIREKARQITDNERLSNDSEAGQTMIAQKNHRERKKIHNVGR